MNCEGDDVQGSWLLSVHMLAAQYRQRAEGIREVFKRMGMEVVA
jgi:hypothetical protein